MANWKKADLIADLNAMYVGISTPENPGSEGAINGVTKYVVNVNEVGKSEANVKPTGYRKNITFYVKDEGTGTEQAWYERSEPVNESDTDISTSANSGISYSTIYNSPILRKRTLGFMIKAIGYVIIEADTVPNHALRLAWAKNAMQMPEKYLSAFMIEMASNGDVRTKGNSILDTDLEWIVNSVLETVANAFV
jgi:hypothetical protein